MLRGEARSLRVEPAAAAESSSSAGDEAGTAAASRTVATSTSKAGRRWSLLSEPPPALWALPLLLGLFPRGTKRTRVKRGAIAAVLVVSACMLASFPLTQPNMAAQQMVLIFAGPCLMPVQLYLLLRLWRSQAMTLLWTRMWQQLRQRQAMSSVLAARRRRVLLSTVAITATIVFLMAMTVPEQIAVYTLLLGSIPLLVSYVVIAAVFSILCRLLCLHARQLRMDVAASGDVGSEAALLRGYNALLQHAEVTTKLFGPLMATVLVILFTMLFMTVYDIAFEPYHPAASIVNYCVAALFLYIIDSVLRTAVSVSVAGVRFIGAVDARFGGYTMRCATSSAIAAAGGDDDDDDVEAMALEGEDEVDALLVAAMRSELDTDVLHIRAEALSLSAYSYMRSNSLAIRLAGLSVTPAFLGKFVYASFSGALLLLRSTLANSA